MLNLELSAKLNLTAEVKKTTYPITFDRKNVCVHCGAEGSLIFVDKFGRETNKEIHPFDHMKCRNCGRNYSILWKRDEETGKVYPSAVGMELKQEFLNLLQYKEFKENGVKEE